jgi:acyl-homoserine-lactone acylase
MWSVITAQFDPAANAYTPIRHGNSYMQVISWDEAGRVDARAILSYSQSEDPRSDHFADQTRLYSQSQWLDLPFYGEDILADPALQTLTLRE